MVRAKSGCDEDMLGALFLHEEKPEPELDIFVLFKKKFSSCRVLAEIQPEKRRIDDGPVAVLIACGEAATASNNRTASEGE